MRSSSSGSSSGWCETPRLAAVLHERVDAEAQVVVEREREVDLELLLERAALRVGHDVEDEPVRVLRRQRRPFDALDVAVDAQHRRLARRQVEVRGLLRHSEPQQLIDRSI